MANVDDYKFLEIKDAIASLNQRVNLIGVVLEFSIPRPSRGTDCFVLLKIIDESHRGPGLPVNVFTGRMEELPLVESPGDIIVLSNVVMKIHGNDVYALFNKKFSSFALYEGKDGEDFIPYQVSRKFHQTKDNDKRFIAGLRKWLVGIQLDTGREEPLLLSDSRQGERVDLVCKVLHTCEITKDEWLVYVWDGSDIPPVRIETSLEEEKEHPLPLHIETLPLSRDVLCTFPTLGTILRVFGDGGNELGLRLLSIGKWVRFLNIILEVHNGFWRGMVMPFTRVRYIPEEDRIVSERLRSFKERVSTKWDRMLVSNSHWPSHITETDYERVPFVTLMDVVTYSEATAKFKCVVRVVAAYPWRAEDFCSSHGTYRIRLTLEDPTARIHAFIYGEDGEKFFGGHPPIDVLEKKRKKLLGITECDYGKEIDNTARDPPWVQCCLKSYHLDDGDIWGSRNYRIFGTRMLG